MASGRRLAAVLSADVVGFSRRMETNEPAALAALWDCRRQVIDPRIETSGGRLVKNTGDGVLVEFTSATDAVNCAVDIQRELVVNNEALPESDRLAFRIGISAGEVIVEQDDIYGDDVNIAFRLQAIAEPGGVVISGTTFEQIRKARLALRFDDLGEQALKNMERKTRAYRVLPMANSGPLFLFAPSSTEAVEPPPVPTKPSIVVMPIVNISGDPAQDYIADGFTDDVIGELGRFRSLLVIGRTATYAWKGRPAEPMELRTKLGVQYALQGTIRRMGPHLRLSVELIATDTGERFWGERYDAEWKDVFTIQARSFARSSVHSSAGWKRSGLNASEPNRPRICPLMTAYCAALIFIADAGSLATSR
jgi:adenylate cyclase